MDCNTADWGGEPAGGSVAYRLENGLRVPLAPCLEYMGVDLGGAHVRMAQLLLHCLAVRQKSALQIGNLFTQHLEQFRGEGYPAMFTDFCIADVDAQIVKVESLYPQAHDLHYHPQATAVHLLSRKTEVGGHCQQ